MVHNHDPSFIWERRCLTRSPYCLSVSVSLSTHFCSEGTFLAQASHQSYWPCSSWNLKGKAYVCAGATHSQSHETGPYGSKAQNMGWDGSGRRRKCCFLSRGWSYGFPKTHSSLYFIISVWMPFRRGPLESSVPAAGASPGTYPACSLGLLLAHAYLHFCSASSLRPATEAYVNGAEQPSLWPLYLHWEYNLINIFQGRVWHDCMEKGLLCGDMNVPRAKEDATAQN